MTSVLPGQKHTFPDVSEEGLFCHPVPDQRYSLSNLVADCFQEDRLLSVWNAECSRDKLHEILARGPCLLAKESNPRCIVLTVRVYTRREEIGRR